MSNRTVFISYSHDSDEHRRAVLSLSERLRADGVEANLDQYVNGSPEQGWPRWMLDQLDEADFVVVVCTETYYRRFRGHEEPGRGAGVDWEGALITQEIYESRSRTLKFVPVFLTDAVDDWIPDPLRGVTHYKVTDQEDYGRLYDFLLGQAGVEPRPVGTPKVRRRPSGGALEFRGAPEAAPAGATRDDEDSEPPTDPETHRYYRNTVSRLIEQCRSEIRVYGWMTSGLVGLGLVAMTIGVVFLEDDPRLALTLVGVLLVLFAIFPYFPLRKSSKTKALLDGCYLELNTDSPAERAMRDVERYLEYEFHRATGSRA